MEGHDPLLTRREVSALFHVNTKTIRRWVLDGHLTEIHTPGGYPRYLESEVRALLSFPDDDRPGAVPPLPSAGPVPPSPAQEE